MWEVSTTCEHGPVSSVVPSWEATLYLCRDSERFISTCNDLQEHGRYPKSLQDSLGHRYCVPRHVLWLLAVVVLVEELADEWDSNP